MGAECCRLGKQMDEKKDLAPDEEEITFNQYTSESDKTFKKLEHTYNLLREIPLADYLTLIKTFSPETSTVLNNEIKFPDTYSSDEPFFSEQMDIDTFQSFLENQLLKHPAIYSVVGQKTREKNAFKESLLEMIKGLKLKLDQRYGKKDPNRIQKSHIIILGLLYCNSRNVAKIKVFYDLFAKDGKLAPSKKLDDFVVSMFILSSYSLLSATKKLGLQYDFIGEIQDEDIKNCLNYSELKDSTSLLQIFNEKFFESNKEMTFSEVKCLFTDKNDGLGWLFNTKGIRYMQEKYNVE